MCEKATAVEIELVLAQKPQETIAFRQCHARLMNFKPYVMPRLSGIVTCCRQLAEDIAKALPWGRLTYLLQIIVVVLRGGRVGRLHTSSTSENGSSKSR